MVKLYFCVGCRQVHYDNDYSEKDGDLEIPDFKKFLESVERRKKEIESFKCSKCNAAIQEGQKFCH